MTIFLPVVWQVLLIQQKVFACSVCFGGSDPKTLGALKIAIVTMLGALSIVAGGIAAFILQTHRRNKLHVHSHS